MSRVAKFFSKWENQILPTSVDLIVDWSDRQLIILGENIYHQFDCQALLTILESDTSSKKNSSLDFANLESQVRIGFSHQKITDIDLAIRVIEVALAKSMLRRDLRYKVFWLTSQKANGLEKKVYKKLTFKARSIQLKPVSRLSKIVTQIEPKGMVMVVFLGFDFGEIGIFNSNKLIDAKEFFFGYSQLEKKIYQYFLNKHELSVDSIQISQLIDELLCQKNQSKSDQDGRSVSERLSVVSGVDLIEHKTKTLKVKQSEFRKITLNFERQLISQIIEFLVISGLTKFSGKIILVSKVATLDTLSESLAKKFETRVEVISDVVSLNRQILVLASLTK